MVRESHNNKKQPLVSVIIPTYNTGVYIKEAVDSALSQTHPNIEIIVVDDGSTDNTKAVLQPYINSEKVKYIYQRNKGLPGARNTAIKEAKGKYVALLDADDLFLPDKLGRQVQHLEENKDLDLSYCDIYHFKDSEPDKLLRLNYTYYSGEAVFEKLLEKNFIAPLSVVVRRSVFDRLGYFDESLRRSEDYEFYLRLAYGGAKIDFLPTPLAKLRIRHRANLQGLESQPKMKMSSLNVLKMVSERMSGEDREKYKMIERIETYKRKLGWAYLMVGDKKAAKEYLSPMISVLASIVPTRVLSSILAKLYYRNQARRFSRVGVVHPK